MSKVIAALLAVDPVGLGGVALRAPACAARDAWLATLRQLLPSSTPLRRVPLNINDAGLLGGLDLGATLQAGRPIAQHGILTQADGGVVVLAMAERMSSATAARLGAVLDSGEVVVERDGFALRCAARLGVVALDEGADDDEQVPAALLDRLAFHVQLVGQSDHPSPPDEFQWDAGDIAQARALLPSVSVNPKAIEAMCAASLALGIDSMRAPILALRVARVAAALSGETEVADDHMSLAARLVLAPRARQWPAPPQSAPQEESEPQEASEDSGQEPAPAPENSPPEPDAAEETSTGSSLAETVIEAAKAAIPVGLLAALKIGDIAKSRAQTAGRAGAVQKSQTRGRPIGARRGEPRAGSRINVIETLRAAAPWQKLREREAQASGKPAQRIHVRKQDFHVTRFKQVGQTTTLFVVDASGSSALNRLAEAKGAVELLLADCYVRRDRVAVLAFKGKTAELLLPPTRSLARAKRSLAGLPGGGGTPLATAIDAARELADQIKRRGETPIVVLLTDGRGNIARDGTPGRVQASEDALAAARQIRFARLTSLLLDTSPQPQAAAQAIAQQMGATYVPLPYAGAHKVAQVVRALATT
jgi:magnesium chelatase subunit D